MAKCGVLVRDDAKAVKGDGAEMASLLVAVAWQEMMQVQQQGVS